MFNRVDVAPGKAQDGTLAVGAARSGVDAPPLPRSRRRFANRLAQVVFVFLAVGTALAVRVLLIPLTGTGAPYVLFFGAVLVTAIYCGPAYGVGAAVLSAPLGSYEFVVRAGYSVSQSIWQALLFFAECLLAVYLSFMVSKARRRAEAAAASERAEALARERLLCDLDRQHRMLQAIVDQLPAAIVVRDATSGELLLNNPVIEAIWRGPADAPKYDRKGGPSQGTTSPAIGRRSSASASGRS